MFLFGVCPTVESANNGSTVVIVVRMTSFTQKKTTKVRKHWTQKSHETVLRRDGNDQFHLEIEGGASQGLFPLISNADQNRVSVI